MEITKKGIQIMSTIVLASSIQSPGFILGAIIIIGIMLVAKGGDVRKF
jgi:hypothetical protein